MVWDLGQPAAYLCRYTADKLLVTLKQVRIAARMVSTFAGDCKAAGSIDGSGVNARFAEQLHGISYDGSGALYVADTQNSTIRKIDIATQHVTTVVGVAKQSNLKLGPLPGSLYSPVFVLPVGRDLFILDLGAGLLRAHFP